MPPGDPTPLPRSKQLPEIHSGVGGTYTIGHGSEGATPILCAAERAEDPHLNGLVPDVSRLAPLTLVELEPGLLIKAQKDQRCGTVDTDIPVWRRNMVVFASFAALFSSMGTQYSFGAYLPAFLDEFGESRARTSLVHSVMVGCLTASGTIVGPLVQQYGHRAVFCAGGATVPVFLVLASITTSLPELILCGGFLGVSLNLMWCPSVSIPTLFFSENRAFAVGIANSGSGLGAALLSYCIHLWSIQFGWRGAMRIQALLCAGTAVLAAPFFIAPPTHHHTQRAPNSKRIRCPCDFSLFRDPVFVLLWVGLFLNSITLFSPFAHVVKHAEDSGLDAGHASAVLSFVSIFNCLGRFSQGFLADKCRLGRTPVFAISQVAGGLAVLGLVFCSTWNAFLVWAVFFGFFGGCFIAMFTVMVADLFGAEHTAVGIGLSQQAFCLGNYVGLPLCGYLFDVQGSYKHAWLFVGSAGILAGTLSAAIPAADRYFPDRPFGEKARAQTQ
jgi:MCP family monocarboxylic acid transporter-like MFS transporter 10